MGLLRDMRKKRGSGGGRDEPPKPPEPKAEPIAKTPASAASVETLAASAGAAVATGPEKAQSPGSIGAYERDYAERAAFEKAEHVILAGTVQRLRFGRILDSETPGSEDVSTREAAGCSDGGHMKGYVWGLGERPSGVRGKLALVRDGPQKGGDDVFVQLEMIMPSLERHAIPPREGPYADKDGHVERFAEAAFRGLKGSDLYPMIERLIDIRPEILVSSGMPPEMARSMIDYNRMPRHHSSGHSFVYGEAMTAYLPPDEIPSAGLILGQEGRKLQSRVTGAEQFALMHPFEQYMLAAAALRIRGIMAYPAQAVMPGLDGGEATAPLLAVIDMTKDVPLVTFDLTRFHPNMGAIDLLSDRAVQGAAHAMLAETRIRHLVAEIISQSLEDRQLSPDEAGNQLNRIARCLFESVKRWDGNPFIPRAMTMLSAGAGSALLESDINRHRLVNGKEAADAIAAVAGRILAEEIDPESIQSDDPIVLAAKETAIDAIMARNGFPHTVQQLLGKWISEAKKEQDEG